MADPSTSRTVGETGPRAVARPERAHFRSSSDSTNWQDRSFFPNDTTRKRVLSNTPVQNQSGHRFTASRLRQRQSSPRASLGSAIECERIQQVFFPPFEEAGESSILEVATQDTQRMSSGGDPLTVRARYDTRTITRFKPRPTEHRLDTSLEHGRNKPQDSTTSLPPFRWEHRAQASLSDSDSGLHLGPSILRESGLLLNSASSFISHPTRLEKADITMEVMEMRPRTLRRSVTSAEDAENVKVSTANVGGIHVILRPSLISLQPSLMRSNTIASSRPTKRKAMSADMGSRGRFQGFTTIQSSETAPQLGTTPRSTKPRPPPLRELPPPSWSSPGHSPPLTSLAPPFSRDMFLFPIKNSVNLSPVSPIYCRPFSTMMSPPSTPETRVTRYDSSTHTPIVPSALSTSHLGPTHYLDVIDSHMLTVNRCRRRSSMSSFGSTAATIRPWDVCGDLTPKASRAQLLAQAMETDEHVSQTALVPRQSQPMQECRSDEGWTTTRDADRDERSRKTEKRSRLEDHGDDVGLTAEQTKTVRRRAEGRKISGALRL